MTRIKMVESTGVGWALPTPEHGNLTTGDGGQCPPDGCRRQSHVKPGLFWLCLCVLVFGAYTSVMANPPSLDDAHKTPAGPMVGHTTATSALVWMYTPAGTDVLVRFGPAGSSKLVHSAKLKSTPTTKMGAIGRVWRAELNDLKPATRYEFAVHLNDGKSLPEHRGSFMTAPEAGEPVKFRIGLTSCMKAKQPQGSLSLFYDDRPDVHLTLGDTVYSDSTDPRLQWKYHLQYRQMERFAKVVRSMPTYAMWDDHDYGPNNSDGGAKGKENSLAGWTLLWHNPPTGTPTTPGAFYKFTWGDVEFFVVDGRYYRSRGKAKDDETKRMLGDAQFKWLIDGLKSSKAKFKVIASGSTLHHSLHDGWRIYTFARHRLFDAIKSNKFDGVVYFGGSLHRSLAWEHHESDRVGYPLVEVISSGIANSKTLSYATVDFDTTLPDPTMTVRVRLGTGKIKQEQTWKLSRLSHK